ncbi:alkaline phosphatase family protein [Granulicella sp. 5B5]|uniref:alkaline phosphatase family protein n=1 Tax=Granulicella sp. 5B5 TaxID=1617967 RepID=UPI001C70B233|nr:alkaline phosphatase family protein [Granulicella sp. 5B5]
MLPSARRSAALLFSFAALTVASRAQQSAPEAHPHHNVILFVADGLRRNSVTPEDMPTLYRLRTEGVDLRNSHSVYPSVTTANASAIATGHGLGDTGDYGNVIYPGFYLTDPFAPAPSDGIAPFLENDSVLATMNAAYNGNYLGETTLLEAAHKAGFSVAAVGKLGPTAIQLLPSVHRNELGQMDIPETLILDESTGHANSVPLPLDFADQLLHSGLPTEAPLRTNGFPADSQWSNGFSGNGAQAGTLAANTVQEQWLADVTTKLILPDFAKAGKPFVLLFWSRDPDGTQHNQGDSFQNLSPGINGPTVTLALRNADHCLAELLDWLDKHPAIKANTDVLVTSDHGFATISRRELDSTGDLITTPAAALTYKPVGHDKPEPASTLPTGFLGIDLALFTHQHLFDPSQRATSGDSVYAEVPLSGETSSYPANGSALLGDSIHKLDGSDARVLIESNGGSDFLYVPSKDPAIVNETIAALSDLDYIAGIFVDDSFCPTATSCPGALPLSSVGIVGASHMPRPTIVVSFKHFFLKPGDMQSGIQITDTNLQEGQGNHGALARDQTWNNMAAIGPDFKHGYVDPEPVGNIDITPTVAAILGIDLPAHGTLKGRVMTEALSESKSEPKSAAPGKTLVSAPAANGRRTILDYQEHNGVHYYDRACMIKAEGNTPNCPE